MEPRQRVHAALGLSPEQVRGRFPGANFHGGLDTQHPLPFGTAEQVRAEVHHLVEALGGQGHYILSTSHNLQGGVPMENLVANLQMRALFDRMQARSGKAHIQAAQQGLLLQGGYSAPRPSAIRARRSRA